MRSIALLVLLGALPACATTHQTGPSQADFEAATSPAPAPPAAGRSPDVIPRAEMNAVLDAGVSAFLQHVDEQPFLDGGRFVGWQILAFYPGDPRFAGAGVERGDVILRVNGRLIERPEQLMELWTALRSCRELTIDLLRDGQPRHLHYTIAD